MKQILSIILLLAVSFTASAQASRHQLREGNRDYNKQRYEKAEVNYRRALQRDSTDFRGQYNLANDLYRQEKYGEAASHYQQALAAPALTDHQRAQALHNQGNSYLKSAQQSEQMEGLQQAIHSYQEALKLEPKRDDTRYNLAYARRLLQQQQQNQQNKGQNNDNNDNNQQQQQQQDQQDNDQQQKQQQQQQNQQHDQQDQQDQQRQQQPSQAKPDQRKQDAERMLDAVKNNEKQTLRDVQKTDKKARRHTNDKDW